MDRPRRPASVGRSVVRRPERVKGRVRPGVRQGGRRAGAGRGGPAGRPAPVYVGLTTRAAILGLVLCTLVVSAALPLREYLSQRSQIGQLEQTQAQQRTQVAALERRTSMLADPTFVASLARERLHFVKPGETTYVVLGAEDPSLVATPQQAPRPAGPAAPWWSQLYGSVRAADRPDAG